MGLVLQVDLARELGEVVLLLGFSSSGSTNVLSTVVRNHDVYTHGHVLSADPTTHVAEWKFNASCYREGHELVMNAVSHEKLAFTFD